MSGARRRAVATAIALATVLALRLLLPDAAERRDRGAFLLLALGYGHQLGALVAGLRRGVGVEGLLRFAALGTVVAAAAALLPLGPLACILIALALWHVFENGAAMARAPGRGRLPPLVRSPAALRPIVLALGATVAVLLAPGAITRSAVAAGVPPGLAVWSVEDLVGLLLLQHVLDWGLFAAREGRRRFVLLVHALPLGAAAGAALLMPAALDALASPALYLLASVAHALHTALERGVAAR